MIGDGTKHVGRCGRGHVSAGNFALAQLIAKSACRQKKMGQKESRANPISYDEAVSRSEFLDVFVREGP